MDAYPAFDPGASAELEMARKGGDFGHVWLRNFVSQIALSYRETNTRNRTEPVQLTRIVPQHHSRQHHSTNCIVEPPGFRKPHTLVIPHLKLRKVNNRSGLT